MRNCHYKIKKTTFAQFCKRRIVPKAGVKFFFFCIICFLTSCSSPIPKQTYLGDNKSLSDINRLAVVVSVNSPEVSYRVTGSESGAATALCMQPSLVGALGCLIGLLLEAESYRKYGSDSDHASKISEQMNNNIIEDKTAHSFIQPLKKENRFKKIEQISNKDIENHQLIALGYDAVIKLTVREIEIRREPGDYVRLSAIVHGQLQNLSSGNVPWDRQEAVTNSEPRTINYYRENGLRELDSMLEKAAKRLAYDFIYLK